MGGDMVRHRKSTLDLLSAAGYNDVLYRDAHLTNRPFLIVGLDTDGVQRVVSALDARQTANHYIVRSYDLNWMPQNPSKNA